MIHHCEIVATPRRVTVIPAVPAPTRRRGKTWLGLGALLMLLLSIAVTLGAQARPAAKPDSAKAAAPSFNWLSDKRAFQVGDIIRVYVDEYANAEANKSTSNSASRRRKLEMGASPPSMPGGTAMGDINATVETGDGGTSSQRGNAARDTRYVGDVAARVVAITPEGLLQIKGTKTIDVDKNKTVLTLSGFVRPIDVGARDMIHSESIADAQISYSAKGGLGKPKNGIFSKIFGILWP